jgi:topoisomerase IA-like protein
LGKVGNDSDSLFLNFSKFINKYNLKLTSLKDNMPIQKNIDVDKITLEDAKTIVDNHMVYNNKIIGSRDDKDVILKNGQFGLYVIWNKQLFTLPKFAIDKLDKLDIKTCNYIIDYQL